MVSRTKAGEGQPSGKPGAAPFSMDAQPQAGSDLQPTSAGLAERSPQTRSEAQTSGQRTDLWRHLVTPEALGKLPEDLARKWMVIPIAVSAGTLRVAMADPSNIVALEALAASTGMRIEALVASAADIGDAIDANYNDYEHIAEEAGRISPAATAAYKPVIEIDGQAPVTRTLKLLLEEAAKSRASDLLIEPQSDRVRVRYRIDGILHEIISMPMDIHAPLISQIKILANMNIADSRRPQDGQMSVSLGSREIDVRVGTANTVLGEMAVLRLLDKGVALFPLNRLGFSSKTLQRYEAMVKAPWGMVLVSGPTGAGKTTTLYATVNSLDKTGAHIITIEDPVEYRFEGINQIQVNAKAGLTFPTGLRSMVRLSPDVILVGEIRDAETAAIATQSALTGHLVLSSLHANDSVGVLFRLLDLGVEPFMVGATVIGILTQRLIRRLCPYCASSAPAAVEEQLTYRRETGEERDSFRYSVGCKSCANTGYLGRIGIFELLVMTDGMKRLMTSGASTVEIRAQAIKDGMVPLVKDGMLKVKAGLTTPREVLRSVFSGDEMEVKEA